MEEIAMKPIGHVRASRQTPGDDHWGQTVACIELTPDFGPEALKGIEEFSHVEILFYFHLAGESYDQARHPRGNPNWPVVGIFAQRGKDRPNRIGASICRVLSHDGTKLYVAELDAIDGTPVLDIKPVMSGFLPRGEVREPAWCAELMLRYWG